MEISMTAAIYFAISLCFKVCLAQELTQATSSPYEATIWTARFLPTDKIDHFALTPTRSAAVISKNLILTVEETGTSNPLAEYVAVFFQTNLFVSTKLSSYHHLTKVTFPTRDTDAKTPTLAVFKVTPALDALDLQPIRIRGNNTQLSETCTISVWKTDINATLFTARREIVTTGCLIPSNTTFCVKLLPGDINLRPFEGGLIVCNEQLAGLHSTQIASTESQTRSYLDLAPYRERIEKLITDNTPSVPAHSVRVTASAALCLVFVGLIASGGVA